jgi:predicted RNA-binding Zn ribbon-like protein
MQYRMEAPITHTTSNARKRKPQFELIAGSASLDFMNTVDDRFTAQPKELLPSYSDLVRFAEEAGVMSPAQAEHLIAASLRKKEEAENTLKNAIRMREAMFAVFWAIVEKEPVPQTALHALNKYVQEAAQHVRLLPGRSRFRWEFEPSRDKFDAPLWPIARSAAELLASDQLQFVRACASKTCDWLFLDESKNHRRRWCDMTKCGNRAKVRRFYSRMKKEAS